LFDFLRLGVSAQSKSLGEAGHMRIDDDAGLDAEGVSHHDIGRLAAHSIEGDEGLHRLRNLSPVLFHQDATAGLDIAGLVAEEPDAADVMG
jgi:hypothetical protein